MNKNDLITILNQDLEKGRISSSDFTAALELYDLIYEQKSVGESGSEHERLTNLINTAADVDEEDLKKMLKSAAATLTPGDDHNQLENSISLD